MKKRYYLFFSVLSLIFMLTAGCVLYASEADEDGQDSPSTGYEMRLVSGKGYLYRTATGKKVTGLTGIQELPAGSGNFYYFRTSKGRIYRKCMIRKNGNVYHAEEDGTLSVGWTDIKGKDFYFHRKKLVMATGWKKISGKRYYFSKKGAAQKGLKKIGSYTYYLDPENKGASATGWKEISGKWYYFAKTGRMRTGFVKISGEKYYFSKKGVRQTGLLLINNHKYYFDPDTGKMATGWTTVNGNTYYFSGTASKLGQAVTGWMATGGKTYYLNDQGLLQKGWLTLNGKKYYLDPSTGEMTVGQRTIDGKSYTFNSDGTLKADGPVSIKVNLGTCVVTIYQGSVPVKAMLCSPSAVPGDTPSGTFTLLDKLRWHTLNGPCYGQYCSHITGSILFHSVWYYQLNNRTLADAEYWKLGSPASHGCIRLACGDAYYMYQKCPVGTKVTIFRGSASDDPLPRPSIVPLRTSGVDPTDPAITGKYNISDYE